MCDDDDEAVPLTGSGDRGRRGRAQMTDLEHKPHGGVQGDPLITGQRQHLQHHIKVI